MTTSGGLPSSASTAERPDRALSRRSDERHHFFNAVIRGRGSKWLVRVECAPPIARPSRSDRTPQGSGANRPQKQMPPDMARRLQAPITAIRCLTPRGPAHQVLEPKITAHAQYDDFTVEVSSLEQLRDALQLAHCCTSPSSTSQHIGLRLRVCTRARPGRLALAGRPYFQRLRADRSGFQVRPTDGNTRSREFKASTGTSC